MPARFNEVFSCSAVFPLAPAKAIEVTAATLNGEMKTFSVGPAVLATSYKD